MAIMNDEDEVLHRIEAKLYPNYLGAGEGAYVARSKPEAPLSVENICVSAKNRGGYTGGLPDLIEHSTIFLNEMTYQLLDGFSVFYRVLEQAHILLYYLAREIDPDKYGEYGYYSQKLFRLYRIPSRTGRGN